MGGGNQNALKKAIRALRKQHRGNSLVEQALKQLDPPRKRGRWKGTAPYLKSDAVLMLEAYYLYWTGRFTAIQRAPMNPCNPLTRHWCAPSKGIGLNAAAVRGRQTMS